jgi:hypothetical protein
MRDTMETREARFLLALNNMMGEAKSDLLVELLDSAQCLNNGVDRAGCGRINRILDLTRGEELDEFWHGLIWEVAQDQEMSFE